jgi:hypothetical protein
MTAVDFDARYRVDGYGGVAFYLEGYATTEEYEGDYLVCEDEECDHHLSEMCWAEGDTSIVTDHDHVIAAMVGDDRKHTVSVDDLSLLADDDYCSGCGQVGCTADGR